MLSAKPVFCTLEDKESGRNLLILEFCQDVLAVAERHQAILVAMDEQRWRVIRGDVNDG